MRRLALAVLLPSLLAACSSFRGGASSAQAQAEQAAVESALRQVRSGKVDYQISGGDLVSVTVFQQPELERKVRVSQKGTVSLPLVGAVEVGGLTVGASEAAIEKKLSEYLVNPQVTLVVQEYGSRKIFILGEVKEPGSFELPAESRMTVLEAVSQAGGFTPIAAPDRTRVIRSKDGRSQTLYVEVSDITKRGQKHKDVVLEPNDVVYVPQSYF